MKKYKRVSYAERCQIFVLLKEKIAVPDIARRLGFNKTTIYREIKRNTYSFEYNHVTAQRLARDRYSRCRRKKVIRGELRELIASKLRSYWTPAQISGRLRFEVGQGPSHETIYRYVRKNKPFQKYLPLIFRSGHGRLLQRRRNRSVYLNIRDRPEIINRRERIGDWERDGMYIADKRQILVCTDRRTRLTKLAVMKESNSNYVNDLTLKLLLETGKPVLSITNDNGSEFRKPLKVQIPVYHCDPLRPDQRGTVENMIGVLRKQIPRSTKLDKIGEQGIKEIERQFNLRPRRGLGFKCPYEVFYETKVALVS